MAESLYEINFKGAGCLPAAVARFLREAGTSHFYLTVHAAATSARTITLSN
jgi:hypothetical protein